MDGRILLPVVLIAVTILTCGCTGSPSAPAQTPSAATASTPVETATPASAAFTLSVDSLSDGATLPSQYTCTGTAESPEISWTNVPNGTVSLALLLEDPDAPSGTFTHWILYNIPPGMKRVPAGISATKELDDGGKSGQNSVGGRGYYPPCPPVGTTHRYIFWLYALDEETGLAYATRDDLGQVFSGHILGTASVTTRFGR